MDLNESSALGAALGSLGLGAVALWSWFKLHTALHRWEKHVCTVVALEDATFVNDGDTSWILRVAFDTPRGRRTVTPDGYNTQADVELQKVTYAIGSEHMLYVGPSGSEAYVKPPWGRYNPIVPALMSMGFGAAAIAFWMGWIKTGP